jgi:hypothetical protein
LKSPKQPRQRVDDFVEALVAPLGLKCARAIRPLSAFSKANDFSTLIQCHSEKL